jgi:hypothetical protein
MTIFRAAMLGAAFLAGISAGSQAAIPFTVSLESEMPSLQNSTSGFFSVGIEDFDARATGRPQTITTGFGGSVFSGTYTGLGVNMANRFGGAGGTGKFANAPSNASYSLDLTSSEPGGVTYFGFWLSALDRNNNVSFFQGGNLLFTFTAANAATFINGLPDRNSYFGNPNANFLGQNGNEPYSFLNFYARGGTRFDRVLFSQGSSGGYESDNHTVGRWSRMSGTIIGGNMDVPEPATWAMLITGFGMVGVLARRRRRNVVVA